MDYKKIAIKKSGLTLTSLVITFLIVIGMFTGLFIWLQRNVDDAGVTLDSKYSDTYSKLNDTITPIDTRVNQIRNSLNKISEAENAVQVAWNGLKGLGATLLLPVAFIQSANNMVEALTINLDVIPSWIKTLAIIGIIATVTFLILSALKGDPKL